jgi:hypothetical protein
MRAAIVTAFATVILSAAVAAQPSPEVLPAHPRVEAAPPVTVPPPGPAVKNPETTGRGLPREGDGHYDPGAHLGSPPAPARNGAAEAAGSTSK